MPRYSAQMRSTILKKMLPPENRTAVSLAREYNLSVTTIYGWKARMKHGTLDRADGVLSNQDRSLAEKLQLLLESRRIDADTMGQWL